MWVENERDWTIASAYIEYIQAGVEGGEHIGDLFSAFAAGFGHGQEAQRESDEIRNALNRAHGKKSKGKKK